MSCVAELGCVGRGGECCCPSLEARRSLGGSMLGNHGEVRSQT